ncbi:MAG: DeoR/GlpR family DNA-binding transcription regulator [Atopobiaceae bacterium]|jgi:DeoR/GlpR family transcriptional regulator of sugar metabolism|nr:DeoR/GlpR family DNA-binding transcription regulator [Olegusella sp.]MCI1934047.1 DeoR/GlpR family DNA-binding transcription regulator [Atopobiaceae bacterium]
MGKRDAAILDILNVERKVEVRSLAARLGVSTVTMRKDLDALAAQGIVEREHGFALLGNPDNVKGRLARHYEKKLAIARSAAQLVHDGDTVLIENGSCCALLALTLAETRRNITMVTNSTFIANYLPKSSKANIVLLGGIYQASSQVTVGAMVKACVKDFFVPLMFIGADGWISGKSFTNADHLRAEAVRDMARQAEQVVVLTESEKFFVRGVVPLHVEDKISVVVTDDGIPQKAHSQLKGSGAKIVFAQGEAS